MKSDLPQILLISVSVICMFMIGIYIHDVDKINENNNFALCGKDLCPLPEVFYLPNLWLLLVSILVVGEIAYWSIPNCFEDEYLDVIENTTLFKGVVFGAEAIIIIFTSILGWYVLYVIAIPLWILLNTLKWKVKWL